MCVVSECLVYTARRFSAILSRKQTSPPFLRWCRLPWAPTRLPSRSRPLRSWRWRCCRRVSPWLSVVPPSSFFDWHENWSFLLLRIADFVVGAVDVADVSVSEVVAFPPGEHLAFQAVTHGKIVSSLIFLLPGVFLSFLNLRRNLRKNLRMNFFVLFFAPICQSSVDAELSDRKHRAEKCLDVSFIIVDSVDFFCHVLCCLIHLFQRHQVLEKLGDQILYLIEVSWFLKFSPNFCLVYQNRSCTMSFLIQVPRITTTHSSGLSFSPHLMSLNIDMKMILPLKCSG